MEFILNNKKYAIDNHELFINYLMVDNYFRHRYSKYEYDIRFDFVNPILKKEKVEFSDIHKGAEVLGELIEKQKINFTPHGLRIDQHRNGNFRISYQSISFSNIYVGEAIGVLIALNSLIEYRPAITLDEIKIEVDRFIETQRKKFISQ